MEEEGERIAAYGDEEEAEVVEEDEGGDAEEEEADPGDGDGDDAEALLRKLSSNPLSRFAGGTEQTWCRAVATGSGTSVLALLFSTSPDPSALQQAIRRVQLLHPRLRSQLVWIHSKPAFLVSSHASSTLHILPASDIMHSGNLPADMKNDDQEAAPAGIDWMQIVEMELNANDWAEHRHSLDPKPMFAVKLYQQLLPGARALLVLKIHSAICDRTSAATILTELLHSFYEIKFGRPLPLQQSTAQRKNDGHPSSLPQETDKLKNLALKKSNSQTDRLLKNRINGKHLELMPVEEAIPKGQAQKPFWAHGVDVLSYSLSSRRQGLIPFKDVNQPRRSEVARVSCSVEHTQKLLQTCGNQGTTLFGALSAAGLKAAASCKNLGSHSENFTLITFVDCRSLLEPVFPSSSIGMYHSAVLNTHNVSETIDFWDMARKSSAALDNAMKNRKHFTDMGDVNFLMCQAIQHPHLTPSSSLRTSLMVLFKDPIFDDMEDFKKAVQLENYIGCSSVHGVGPSMAIFDGIQNGALTCAGVYPAPLHSRSQIEGVLNNMISILLKAIE